MKGRFLYVGPFQLPDKNAAAQRVLGIAKLLRLLDYDVVFLDVNKDCKDFRCIPHEVYGFETYSQPYPTRLKQWLKHTLSIKHVQEVLQNHDDWKGIIAYNYPAIALRRLTYLCHRKHILIFADCTEWYEPDFTNMHRMAVTLDSCLRMRWVQKNVDGVIAISSYLATYYRPYTKTVILPPMVDIEEEKWKINYVIYKKDRIHLYYVGSPGGGLGKDCLNIIVKSLYKCSIVDKIVFHVIGITEDHFLEVFSGYRDIIESLKRKGSLIFYGRLQHQDAINLLKNADYSVFFRNIIRMTMAGFPTKFAESITCGVPVITNNTSDLKNYLSDGKNGILVELNSDKIAKMLNTLPERQVEVEKTIFDFRLYSDILQHFLE